MSWKAIGQTVIGTSHFSSGKTCEDAIAYGTCSDANNNEVLVCCVSDGAGSAKYAAEASALVTASAFNKLKQWVLSNVGIEERHLVQMADDIFQELLQKAVERKEHINEFSCTLLGAVLLNNKTAFFQIGDGAIVRDDGAGNLVTVWPPNNGEYQNTTTFLIDDPNLSHFKAVIIDHPVNEIAIFSDGLQLLALNIETNMVHQPFFTGMFNFLRMADDDKKIETLNSKLKEYLASDIINNRTDDDKTLFLGTRLNHAGQSI